MAKSQEKQRTARIGDDAVRAKTGKGWREWFAILDKAGARKLDHKNIVAILRKNCPEVGALGDDL